MGHSYTSKVTAPTATQQGYTTYTCSTCGHSYKDNYTSAQGITVSGKVTSSSKVSGKATIELWQDGAFEPSYTTVAASSGTYSLEGVEAGTYILTVSKYGHVTREYTITVSKSSVTKDVKICLIGDVTGDGQVNIGDAGKIYAHVKGTTPITDAYAQACANVNGGNLNIGDVGAVYSHVKGTRTLFDEI